MMFGLKKHKKSGSYDKDAQIPVIHASICNGEKVAGFKDKATGKFEDIMLIRNEKDMQEFCLQYGVLKEEIKKEW